MAAINRERVAKGLSPLALDGSLSSIARRHARRMAREGDIFHNQWLSSSRARKQMGNPRTIAENVAVGGDTATVHRGLMGSAGHRANILGGRFTRVGVGVSERNGALYVSQVFVSPAAAAGRRSHVSTRSRRAVAPVAPARPAPTRPPVASPPPEPLAAAQPDSAALDYAAGAHAPRPAGKAPLILLASVVALGARTLVRRWGEPARARA